MTPRRMNARALEAGLLETQVVDTVSQYVSAPVSVRVLGVDVDTSVAAEAADPARLFVKDAVARLGDAVASFSTAKTLGADEKNVNVNFAAPVPWSFPGARAWMLTTYVDEDTRVARTEGGSVYLFERIRAA